VNIGAAAKSSGVSAKMIRYYEQIGLIQAPPRTEGNYRVYTARDIEVLRFIQQARRLGFPMAQIATLLSLWEDRARPSRQVKRLALTHIEELSRRIEELTDMRDTLRHLAEHCRGDGRPDCPILDGLARGRTFC